HLPIEIRAWILLAHGGNDGDLQFRLNRGTKRACGHPIAAGLKAWTTDKQICFCVANLLQRRCDHRCQIFHGVIVAAYKGHRDFGIVAHDLLKKFPRTGSALADLQSHARLLFSSDPAEKLIQIMNDAHFRNSFVSAKRRNWSTGVLEYWNHSITQPLRYSNPLLPTPSNTPLLSVATLLAGWQRRQRSALRFPMVPQACLSILAMRR